MGRLALSAADCYGEAVSLRIVWARRLGRHLNEMGPMMICSSMHVQLSRGSSVPTQVRCALFCFDFHSETLLQANGIAAEDITAFCPPTALLSSLQGPMGWAHPSFAEVLVYCTVPRGSYLSSGRCSVTPVETREGNFPLPPPPHLCEALLPCLDHLLRCAATLDDPESWPIDCLHPLAVVFDGMGLAHFMRTGIQ